RTKRLLTTVGNIIKSISERKEKNTWLESSPWKRRELLGVWRISMQVKRQQLSVFFSIQDVFIKYGKHMKLLQQLTGWSRSKRVESRSHLLIQEISEQANVTLFVI